MRAGLEINGAPQPIFTGEFFLGAAQVLNIEANADGQR
jgi:hypothetical protein